MAEKDKGKPEEKPEEKTENKTENKTEVKNGGVKIADPKDRAEEMPQQSEREKQRTVSDALNSDGELITVRSTQENPGKRGGWKQAFSERNERHPGGFAWVANGKHHRVAPTTAVLRAVQDGDLVIVEE